MLRITGGQYKGRNIAIPRGKDIRPTTAFCRESVFSILGIHLRDAKVLDGFAGSGIMSFEALSRGASHVLALDNTSRHTQLITTTRDTLNIAPASLRVETADTFTWAKATTGVHNSGFDIVYLDPPYAVGEKAGEIITALFASGKVAPGGVVIWESDLKAPACPEDAQEVDIRRYGTSTLTFYEALTESVND